MPEPPLRPEEPRTYVAFIRAVMIGRDGLDRRTLVELVTAAGAAGATSHLTTGNVSFVARPSELSGVIGRIEEGIEHVVGRRSELFVRSVEQLEMMHDADPFASAPLVVDHERIVTFFADAPPSFEVPMWSPSHDLVVFAVGRRELFTAAVKRDGMSRGPGGLIERVTGARVTSRAWSTVERILAKLT
jgi:uncharacterized protein (DUF1697 family)